MPNAVSAFLDDTVAGGAADRPAIVTPAGPTTYRELLRLAGRCGNVLRGLGLEPEQRVALLLPDGVGWAATFFGALRIGAVAVTTWRSGFTHLAPRADPRPPCTCIAICWRAVTTGSTC